MKHTINGELRNIDWEQVEKIENFGSGCVDWSIEGFDEEGNQYSANGNYQDGELAEVTDIELI